MFIKSLNCDAMFIKLSCRDTIFIKLNRFSDKYIIFKSVRFLIDFNFQYRNYHSEC